MPAVLLAFLLPRTWGISSRLLQQSAAAAAYLGGGVSLTGAPPDLEGGVATLSPPAPHSSGSLEVGLLLSAALVRLVHHSCRTSGMGEFNSDDHYIYYCGQESLRRNGVAIMVNKRVRNAVLGCSLKNDRMISVHFQGKPFNIKPIPQQ